MYDNQTDMIDDENIILLTDEDGEDVPFQIIDTIDLDNKSYVILAPLDDEEDDGIMIFRVEQDDEGERYEPVDDEHEQQRVFDLFRSDDEDYEFCDAE